MSIDRTDPRPVYEQLADIIRARITSGRFPPGSLLQAEPSLMQEHGVGRDTVRRAMSVLRGEGLVVTDHTGSRVRDYGKRQTFTLPAGTRATARMPTAPERRQLGVGDGVPVFVVNGELYPADRWELLGG